MRQAGGVIDLQFAPDIVRVEGEAPSPMRRAVLYLLLALFTLLLGWAYLGKLDIVAVSQGKLVPQSFLKIVQPAEAGIVRQILVKEGETVHGGHVLMRMDSVASEADGKTLELDRRRKAMTLRRLDAEIERRRELVLRYRELLGDTGGLSLPWTDADVPGSSCYMMAVIIEDGRRDEVRRNLRDRHGVQTTVYPAVHELESYRRRLPGLSLPNSELVAASMFSIPLFPHMSEETQDEVISALQDSVAR